MWHETIAISGFIGGTFSTLFIDCTQDGSQTIIPRSINLKGWYLNKVVFISKKCHSDGYLIYDAHDQRLEISIICSFSTKIERTQCFNKTSNICHTLIKMDLLLKCQLIWP
jgi:hypothetical protein